MWKRIPDQHPHLADAIRHGLVPALIYLLTFCLLNFPALDQFSGHFWGARTDGLQNVWNLWWINLALHRPDLYPSIWYTPLLHWPFGTTLLGHTLAPFNGYLGALLLSFLSLPAAYNTIILFAFVTAGLTMYWLAYYLTRSYWASLAAGFMFAFSSYSLMHLLAGHLNVVSLEWIPLFLLCWVVLITKPGIHIAIGAAFALWLVILSDYYFFLYCVLAAALILCWHAVIRKSVRFLWRSEYTIPLATFAAVALLLIGPLVSSFLISNARDPFSSGHDPAAYSLDLLALFIPGRTWLFNQWTEFFWSRLPSNIKEDSAYLTLPAYVLLAYIWIRRKALVQAARQQVYLWLTMMGFFLLLALGPVLHVAGSAVWDRAMPYTFMGRILPILNVSGVPARMTVMVILSASVLSAIGLDRMFRQSDWQRLLAFALLGVMFFETLPVPVPITAPVIPEYVTVLAGLPDEGGVVDLVREGPSVQMYYQTVHGKPIVFGYISRTTVSLVQKDEGLSRAIEAQDYGSLWETYHIRYIVTKDELVAPSDLPYISLEVVYHKLGVKIYRLGCTCE